MSKRVLPQLIVVLVVLLMLVGPAGATDAGAGTDDTVAVETPPADSTTTGDVDEPTTDEVLDEVPIIRPIVFPVVGRSSYSPGFGDCRDGCTRLHEGIDILTYGWKGLPVVAAHDGVVTRTNFDGEKSGCSVGITDAEGWTTRYLHLNTDIPGTDYPNDLCFAPGIEPGVPILAGTIVGWVGDTGNAEGTVPHLHFEIRDPDGVAVDPWPSLEMARHISFRWIEMRDSIDVMMAAFGDRQPTIHVIDVAEFDSVINGATSAVSLDVPLIAYDPQDPAAARELIKALEPERIVVLSGSGTPTYLKDLRLLAPIVEMATLDVVPDEPAVVPEVPGAEPGGDGADDVDQPTHAHDTVDARYVVMVAGRGGRDVDAVTSGVSGDVVPVLIPGRRLPRDLGADAIGLPGPDAATDGLWWLTADGWRFTRDPAVAPDRGIAYVPPGQFDAPTLAFLLSNATAPAMPIWNHQPISLASKSL